MTNSWQIAAAPSGGSSILANRSAPRASDEVSGLSFSDCLITSSTQVNNHSPKRAPVQQDTNSGPGTNSDQDINSNEDAVISDAAAAIPVSSPIGLPSNSLAANPMIPQNSVSSATAETNVSRLKAGEQAASVRQESILPTSPGSTATDVSEENISGLLRDEREHAGDTTSASVTKGNLSLQANPKKSHVSAAITDATSSAIFITPLSQVAACAAANASPTAPPAGVTSLQAKTAVGLIATEPMASVALNATKPKLSKVAHSSQDPITKEENLAFTTATEQTVVNMTPAGVAVSPSGNPGFNGQASTASVGAAPGTTGSLSSATAPTLPQVPAQDAVQAASKSPLALDGEQAIATTAAANVGASSETTAFLAPTTPSRPQRTLMAGKDVAAVNGVPPGGNATTATALTNGMKESKSEAVVIGFQSSLNMTETVASSATRGSGQPGIEVGFHDTTLGWLSVRAAMADEGKLHVSVAGKGPEATTAVTGMLASLDRYLHEHDVPVQSLTIGTAAVTASVAATTMHASAHDGSFLSAMGTNTGGGASGHHQGGSDSRKSPPQPVYSPSGEVQEIATTTRLNPISQHEPGRSVSVRI